MEKIQWTSGIVALNIWKQPSSFYTAVQIALEIKAVNDKLDKVEKKKSFFKSKLYNLFCGSQRPLDFV